MKFAREPVGPVRLVVSVLLMFSGGCAQFLSLGMRDPIREGIEPRDGGRYYLYKPSNYDGSQKWPLVVVCHGKFPDSAKAHVQHWSHAAESKGFLVVAPTLSSPNAVGAGKTERALTRVRKDEEDIISTIRHVRGAYRISEDRIFIHGWAGGAMPALHTGLKNPDVIRAISVVQPKFAAPMLQDVEHIVDARQPVFVDFSGTDMMTGKHARHLLDWLSGKKAHAQEHGIGPARAGTVDRSLAFYESVIRAGLWMRIKVYAQVDPHGGSRGLTVKFRLKTSVPPSRYHWEFGDGDASPVAEPIHTYPRPGTYRVRVTITTPGGQSDERSAYVEVPHARIKRVQP